MFVGGFPRYSETFITGQLSRLLAHGQDVHVYVLHDPPGPEEAALAPEALSQRTTYIGTPRSRVRRVPGAAMRAARAATRAPRVLLRSARPGQRTLRNLSAFYAVDRLLQDRPEVDVLHAHFGTIANAFLLGPALLHAPLLVTFHGGDHHSAVQARGPNLYRQLFQTADGITVNSEYSRGILERLGCPPERIHRLPIGIDLASFSFSPRELGDRQQARLLTVARLVENKGVAYALRAVQKVRRRHPSLRYEIVGDGPLGDDLRRLSLELGLEDVVTFHGRRDNDFVRERMAECHLFLLPSVTAADGAREGTPVSLLEAQARGMPVLSTLLTGIPEIVVDGVTGFLVRERDVDALADRLGALLSHPESWPDIGRAGRQNVERHHDIDEITEDLIAIYRELIACRRTETPFPLGSL